MRGSQEGVPFCNAGNVKLRLPPRQSRGVSYVTLEKRLSRLKFKITADPAPGLALELNGVLVPPESWNSSLPVDPGWQEIEAFAPGHQPWSGSIEVSEGPVEKTVDIPRLERILPPVMPEKKPTERTLSNSGSTQRTLGLVSGGVGLAALAASGILSYRANALNEDSLQRCRRDDPNACTRSGVLLREDALGHARASTYPFVAGLALLAGGAVLVLSAPSSRPATALRPRVAAVITPWNAAVSLGSRW